MARSEALLATGSPRQHETCQHSRSYARGTPVRSLLASGRNTRVHQTNLAFTLCRVSKTKERKMFEHFVPAITYSGPFEGLPSALRRLTSVFGMRTGGTTALNHQNKRFKQHCGNSTQQNIGCIFEIQKRFPNFLTRSAN